MERVDDRLQFGSLYKGIGSNRSRVYGNTAGLMCYRLIECMREGLVPDINVYEAASWSMAGPLSEISDAKGSAPIMFPDFTRGQWHALKRTDSPTLASC